MFLQGGLQQLSFNTKTNVNTWSYKNPADDLSAVLTPGYFAAAAPVNSEYGWANSIIFAELAGGNLYTLQVSKDEISAVEQYAPSASPVSPATNQIVVRSPNGTTSLAPVMMGLGSPSGIITPTLTGKVLVIASFSIGNSTSGAGAAAQIYTGTGTPPANGDPVQGSVWGNVGQMASAGGVTSVPCSVQAIVNLAIGVPQWIDLGLQVAGGSGAAVISQVSISAVEIG